MSPTLAEDDHDRRLLAAVRPAQHRNPRAAPLYDLVVVGAGTAGLVAAAGAAGLGARVALVERDRLGGDCLNVGCVPSKALIRAARALAESRRAASFAGAEPPEPVPPAQFAAVMERVRRVRADIAAHDSVERFRALGVDVFLGAGRFASPASVEVEGCTLRFKRAVVATGGRPATPEIPGLSDAGFLTNETVFELRERPDRLAIVGAGPIGCELAQAFRRLGSDVVVLETLPGVLGREDADAAAVVRRALEDDGVRFLLGAQIRRVGGDGSARTIHYVTDGAERALEADAILVGAGRAPNVADLGLERAGIAFDAARGITVDDHLRTTNRRVFAAGDVCLAAKFTHAADFSARVVLQNALFLGRKRVSALTIPRCTYTDPEVAHVGLDAREAEARGIAIDTLTRPLAEVDRAIIDGDTAGFVKLHLAKRRDRIVGATIVAAHAGEMIGEVAVAMASGMGLSRLASVIHPYPTEAEAIRQLGDAYNRTRLTPLVRMLFRTWLGWLR